MFIKVNCKSSETEGGGKEYVVNINAIQRVTTSKVGVKIFLMHSPTNVSGELISTDDYDAILKKISELAKII